MCEYNGTFLHAFLLCHYVLLCFVHLYCSFIAYKALLKKQLLSGSTV